MPVIEGTEGSDTLEGTIGDDVIDAKGGDDIIQGTQGKDLIKGGAGNDFLYVSGLATQYFDRYSGEVAYTITDGRLVDSLGRIDLTFSDIEHFVFEPYNTKAASIDASSWGQTANPGGQLVISSHFNDSQIIGSAFGDIIYANGVNTTVDAGAGTDYVFSAATRFSSTYFIRTSGEVTHISQRWDNLNQDAISVDVRNAEYVGITAANGATNGNIVVDASSSGVSVIFNDGFSGDVFIGSPKDDIFQNGHPTYDGATVSDNADTDTFTGGEGADQYLFVDAIRSLDKTYITDFSAADLIDLSGNASNGYLITAFIGTATFSGTAGEYRYENSGGQTLIQYDGDGDGTADGTLTLMNGEFELKEVSTAYGQHGLMIDAHGPSDADDTVVGTEGNDVLFGYGGKDTLQGLGGDDVLNGGPGADKLMGGEGNDTAVYVGNFGGVFVNLTLGRGFTNYAFGDTYDSIENVVGSSYDDFLIGDGNANRLDGAAGNDTIIGAVGADVLIGGDGIDLLSFEDNSGVVFVNLLTGQGFNNAAQGDTFEGFENVVGGLFDDTLIGDDGANRLDGAMGADTLVGNGGADTFVFAHAPSAPKAFDSPNASANVDTIFDFVSAEDMLEISASAFGGGLTAGSLAGDQFLVGSVAGDANDRFVYEQATGQLFFDADGSGAGAQVLVAVLPNHDMIAASDFVIV